MIPHGTLRDRHPKTLVDSRLRGNDREKLLPHKYEKRYYPSYYPKDSQQKIETL